MDEAIFGVQKYHDNDKTLCAVDDSCFLPPPNYTKLGY